jgi:hypothetical protein
MECCSVWSPAPGYSAGFMESLLMIADQLVIPGSYLMGMGRIGNFIERRDRRQRY